MKANTSSELLSCARSWVSDKLEEDGGVTIECDRSELVEILALIREIEVKSAATTELPFLVCRRDRIVAAFVHRDHANQWAELQSFNYGAPHSVLRAADRVVLETYDEGVLVA